VTVLITAALLIGIKFFIGGNGGSEDYQAPKNSPDVFKQEPAPVATTGAPALRSASTSVGGGNSLEMFEKTNAGYASEGVAENKEEAKEEVKASTAAARKAAAAKKTGVKAMPPVTTVIPKLQPSKGFGGSSGTGGPAQGQGGSMPDVNSIINNATKDARKKSGL
jgi:hypothetical protein